MGGSSFLLISFALHLAIFNHYVQESRPILTAWALLPSLSTRFWMISIGTIFL